MWLIFSLFSIIWAQVYAQEGSECVTNSDCFKHQTCNNGYCSCLEGFVKNIVRCYKIKSYGEECLVPAQCEDFRMVCEPPPGDTSEISLCLCDRYHEWNDDIKECVQAKNLPELVGNLTEETKWADEIAASGKKVFFGLVMAGLVSISIGLCLAALCVIYGCCFRYRLPKDSTPIPTPEKIKNQEVASAGPQEGVYMVIPTDLTV